MDIPRRTFSEVFLQSIWFWWISTTLIYSALVFLTSGSRVSYVVGLFVPIGVLSGIAMYLKALTDPWAILAALVLVVTALFATNWLARRAIVNPGRRALVYFIALLVITFCLDVWMYGCWESMEILMNPGPGGGCVRMG